MKELNVELYKKLYLIRRSEEKIREHYYEDEMKTPVHLSIGKEAIEVGVCHALRPHDQFLSTYRSHGVYLARTGETDAFFTELFGKKTGLLRGRSGSMHLCAPAVGFLGTSAIVGSIIPVAVGAAYANKRKGGGRVVAVFFGDGATEEGVFWESLNVACLMKLPVLFVCEDNELAVFTHKKDRQGYQSLFDIVSKYDCEIATENTTDAEVIYKMTKDAIQSIDLNQRPCFLNLKYYRYLEHVGINEDFDAGYRPKEEFDRWYKRDPINFQREKLLTAGVDENDIEYIEKEINGQIEKSFLLAKDAPSADADELFREVY